MTEIDRYKFIDYNDNYLRNIRIKDNLLYRTKRPVEPIASPIRFVNCAIFE
jgi:hypothetical protein